MAEISKDQERAELHKSIGAIADDLRGRVDGNTSFDAAQITDADAAPTPAVTGQPGTYMAAVNQQLKGEGGTPASEAFGEVLEN